MWWYLSPAAKYQAYRCTIRVAVGPEDRGDVGEQVVAGGRQPAGLLEGVVERLDDDVAGFDDVVDVHGRSSFRIEPSGPGHGENPTSPIVVAGTFRPGRGEAVPGRPLLPVASPVEPARWGRGQGTPQARWRPPGGERSGDSQEPGGFCRPLTPSSAPGRQGEMPRTGSEGRLRGGRLVWPKELARRAFRVADDVDVAVGSVRGRRSRWERSLRSWRWAGVVLCACSRPGGNG